jgi:hypothetical protein
MSARLAPAGTPARPGLAATDAPGLGGRGGIMIGDRRPRSCASGAWRALAGWPPTG